MAYYDAFITKWAQFTGTVEQKLNAVNMATAVGTAVPMVIPTHMIYNLVVGSEFVALASTTQQLVRDILGMGTVDASPGTQVRSRMMATFGTATVTRTNLAALAAKYDGPTVIWWQANGYPRPFDMGDVQLAGVS